NMFFVAVAPSDPSVVYVSTDDPISQVYRSSDGGQTFRRTAPDPPGGPVAVDPSDPDVVLAGTSISPDGGRTWVPLALCAQYPEVRSWAIDPADPRTIYAGDFFTGVCRSTDGGATWAPFNQGLTNSEVLDVAVVPTGSTVHAA